MPPCVLAPVFPGCHVICRPATRHGIEPPPVLPSLDKRAGIEPALSLLVAGIEPAPTAQGSPRYVTGDPAPGSTRLSYTNKDHGSVSSFRWSPARDRLRTVMLVGKRPNLSPPTCSPQAQKRPAYPKNLSNRKMAMNAEVRPPENETRSRGFISISVGQVVACRGRGLEIIEYPSVGPDIGHQ